jgi:hypothetical protein
MKYKIYTEHSGTGSFWADQANQIAWYINPRIFYQR